VIVVHKGLAERARASAPDGVIVPVQVFIGDPAVNAVIAALAEPLDRVRCGRAVPSVC